MGPQIVLATPELLERFYGQKPVKTQRAIAVVENGEVLAVGGIFATQANYVIFSEMRQDVRSQPWYRRTLIRAVRRILSFAVKRDIPVLALADPDIEGSENLLKHLGFEPLTQGVWGWQR